MFIGLTLCQFQDDFQQIGFPLNLWLYFYNFRLNDFPIYWGFSSLLVNSCLGIYFLWYLWHCFLSFRPSYQGYSIGSTSMHGFTCINTNPIDFDSLMPSQPRIRLDSSQYSVVKWISWYCTWILDSELREREEETSKRGSSKRTRDLQVSSRLPSPWPLA